jgi:hypothetical protein
MVSTGWDQGWWAHDQREWGMVRLRRSLYLGAKHLEAYRRRLRRHRRQRSVPPRAPQVDVGEARREHCGGTEADSTVTRNLG